MVRETSIKTYSELHAEGYINELQNLVWTHLAKHPSLTDREIARDLNFIIPNKVRPRRKELVDMGLVVERDKRECSVTGRTVLTWEVQTRTSMDKVLSAKKSFVWDEDMEIRTFKNKILLVLMNDVVRYFERYPNPLFSTQFVYAIHQNNGLYECVVKRNRKKGGV